MKRPRTNLTARQLHALRVVMGGGHPEPCYRHALQALKRKRMIIFANEGWALSYAGQTYMMGRWDADAMRGEK